MLGDLDFVVFSSIFADFLDFVGSWTPLPPDAAAHQRRPGERTLQAAERLGTRQNQENQQNYKKKQQNQDPPAQNSTKFKGHFCDQFR